MTNAEKYLKDGVDIQDFIDELRHMTQVMEWNGQQCLFICYIKDWLKEQSKPILSEDEKVILNIFYKRGYIKISRDIDDDIYLKNDEKVICCIIFNELFQFIKPRRRI